MTDSILRSYQAYTHTSIVPFVSVVITFANHLLDNEADGFAFDATDISATPPYVGAPYAGYVSVKDTVTPAHNLSNVALDASTSNLTNSGTSPKTVYWATSPYVRWAPHNLCTQSQTFNTTWNVLACSVTADATTAPDGTSTADQIVESAATNPHFVYQQMTSLLVDSRYTGSIYAKAGTRNYLAFSLDSDTQRPGVLVDLTNGTVVDSTDLVTGSATYSVDTVGSGWYRVSISATAVTDGFFYIQAGPGQDATATWSIGGDSYTGDGTSYISLWGAQLVRGYNTLPYLVTTSSSRIGIPQTYDVSGSKYAIVTDSSMTNICLQTEDFTTTWVNTNTDEPTTNNTAPDASSTADEIAATSTATQAFAIYQSFTGRTAGNFTVCSVFAKPGTNATLIQLAWDSNGGGADGCFCNFNISTGAKGTVTAFAAGSALRSTITSIGGGWYRCSIMGTIASGTVGRFTISIVDSISEAGFGSAALTDNDSIILWGANVCPDATGFGFNAEHMYIPATTVSVTKATDGVNALGSTFPLSPSTANTFYLDFRKNITDSYNTLFFYCSQTADSNNQRRYFSDNGSYAARSEPHGAAYSFVPASTDVDRHQISDATANADWDGSIDGGTLVTAATADYPTGLDRIDIGRGPGFGPLNVPFYYYRFVTVPRQVQTASGNLVTWRYNF